MTYAKIIKDSSTYYLYKQPNDQWYFTSRTQPPYDEQAVEITFTQSENSKVIVNTDDALLATTIANFVTNSQSFFGNKMINYYPTVVNTLEEFQAAIAACGMEFDFLHAEINFTYNDAFLHTMGLARTNEWENALGISPDKNASLETRRTNVIARLQSTFKLNTQSIANLVYTLTGGTCQSYFSNEDSTIYIDIRLSSANRLENFPDLESELKRRIPAHLLVSSSRWFDTWNDIKNKFNSWQDVYNKFESWEYVKYFNKEEL